MPTRLLRPLVGACLALVAVLLSLSSAGPASAVTGHRKAADDRPVVRVGTEGTYPPFTFHDKDDNKLTGYDIDVIRAVARKAGWRLEFVEANFDAVFPALDAGRIDVIANQVTINPERQARYLFSRPYTFSRGVIVTAADEDSITELSDLKGRTTAQSSTSNWAEVARDAGATVRSVEGFAPAAELLVQGRVDAIVNDNIAVLDYLATTGSEDVKISGYAGQEISRQALTFRKSDVRLQRQANQALTELRSDGTLKRISEGYFQADVSRQASAEVDLSERADEGSGSWEVVREAAWPMLVAMAKFSVPLTLIAFAVGLVLALLVALARLSASPLLRWPARAFVSVIRGTPLLVQLFIVFYGLPEFGIKFASFPAAVLAFSLNVAAYAAEVIRAAILSVPKGQSEAAATVGMDYAMTLRRIVLPQATRTAVPPLSNTFISLVKDTSLASVILVPEMFRVAQDYAGASTRYLALYALAAFYYWVVCTVLSTGQDRLEQRLDRYVR